MPHLLLLAEDFPELNECFTRALERDGFHVLAADDGIRAFQIFEAFRDRIDLVLTDGQMPSGDGIWLAERIRSIHATVPIVLLSGEPEDYLDTARELGIFTEVSFKPISLEALVAIARRNLTSSAGSE